MIKKNEQAKVHVQSKHSGKEFSVCFPGFTCGSGVECCPEEYRVVPPVQHSWHCFHHSFSALCSSSNCIFYQTVSGFNKLNN